MGVKISKRKVKVMINICSSCQNVRIGENNTGDTLPAAMEALGGIASVMPAMGSQLLESGIPQAKKGGACQSCLSNMQSLKNLLSRS